jgi:RNA polymerase sigma-70 factor (ECF subfamily)
MGSLDGRGPFKIEPFEGSAQFLARAERIFDAGWAATVVERALRRLREECESKGRLRVFEILSPYLGTERNDLSYAILATKLRVREATVKKLLYRSWQLYRFLLRDEVAQTVADSADVEDELRYLCGALAPPRSRNNFTFDPVADA